MPERTFLRAFAWSGALAVALGAFGAHGLRYLVAAAEIATYETAVRYHFYHTLAGVAGAGLMYLLGPSVRLRWACRCWLIGILLFSGSLYLLSLREVHGLAVAFLGPITPVGGVFLIAGWVLLALGVPAVGAARTGRHGPGDS